jgi:hypothetical protein
LPGDPYLGVFQIIQRLPEVLAPPYKRGLDQEQPGILEWQIWE